MTMTRYTILSCFILMIIFSITDMANSNEKSSKCYAIGYAYSYKTNHFYYSDFVSYTHFGDDCTRFRAHAEITWRHFFSSEIQNPYKYEVNVVHCCGCFGENGKAIAFVEDNFLKIKANYRKKGWSINKLNGFTIRDWDPSI